MDIVAQSAWSYFFVAIIIATAIFYLFFNLRRRSSQVWSIKLTGLQETAAAAAAAAAPPPPPPRLPPSPNIKTHANTKFSHLSIIFDFFPLHIQRIRFCTAKRRGREINKLMFKRLAVTSENTFNLQADAIWEIGKDEKYRATLWRWTERVSICEQVVDWTGYNVEQWQAPRLLLSNMAAVNSSFDRIPTTQDF